VRNLGHHAPDETLHVFFKVCLVSPDVETVTLVIIVRSVSEIFSPKTFYSFPVSSTASSHHGSHRIGAVAIRISSEVEPEARQEHPSVFEVSLSNLTLSLALGEIA
jgi:hypothetical protein